MAPLANGEAIQGLPEARSRLTLPILIPWDADSPDHVNRLKQQRIVCGWNEDAVESWRVSQREGKMGIHWIVLPPSDPDTPSRLHKHISNYPDEDSPLQNTSKMILARPYTPDAEFASFLPVGHISLDTWTNIPELGTSASAGVCSITSFYISKPLQKGGLGAAALSSCERMAAQSFGAKTITLETIGNEECLPNNPRRIAMNLLVIPNPTNEDWYQRRGYTVYSRKKDAWFDIDPTGKRWGLAGICMRKQL